MTDAIRLVLRGVPPSLNQFAGRQNSWEYRNEKKRWTDAVRLTALACSNRPEEPWEFAEVTILYYFPTAGRHDADNYAGKFLLDGLTKAGVIVDDDFAHIRLAVAGQHDKRTPRTVITVREAVR